MNNIMQSQVEEVREKETCLEKKEKHSQAGSFYIVRGFFDNC